MNHKEKVKIAIKLNKNQKRGMWLTDAWLAQKEAIRDRVERKQDSAHERAIQRKGN